jgi:alpha-galactosidase
MFKIKNVYSLHQINKNVLDKGYISNQQSDIATLGNWLKIAARVQSVEEFEEKIGILVK